MCRILSDCKNNQQKASDKLAPPVYNLIARENWVRPCWVLDKKAIFHRWVNVANPALPRGQEPSEDSRYFQHRSTKALVEFEDGRVDLVWPYSVKFADHGLFHEYAWDPVEKEVADNGNE